MGVLLEATCAGCDREMTDYLVAYGDEWLKGHGGAEPPEAGDGKGGQL
jgi:hypothetical protein